jgi:hypothetical protein
VLDATTEVLRIGRKALAGELTDGAPDRLAGNALAEEPAVRWAAAWALAAALDVETGRPATLGSLAALLADGGAGADTAATAVHFARCDVDVLGPLIGPLTDIFTGSGGLAGRLRAGSALYELAGRGAALGDELRRIIPLQKAGGGPQETEIDTCARFILDAATRHGTDLSPYARELADTVDVAWESATAWQLLLDQGADPTLYCAAFERVLGWDRRQTEVAARVLRIVQERGEPIDTVFASLAGQITGSNADPVRQALRSVEALHIAGVDVSPLLPALEKTLNHPRATVRPVAEQTVEVLRGLALWRAAVDQGLGQITDRLRPIGEGDAPPGPAGVLHALAQGRAADAAALLAACDLQQRQAAVRLVRERRHGFGAAVVAEALAEAVGDPDSYVRLVAVITLERDAVDPCDLTPHLDALVELLRTKAKPQLDPAEPAGRVLGYAVRHEVSRDAAIARLRPLLADRAQAVRSLSARALAYGLSRAGDEAEVIALLSHRNAAVRAGALGGLRSVLGPPIDASPYAAQIADLMRGDDHPVALAATWLAVELPALPGRPGPAAFAALRANGGQLVAASLELVRRVAERDPLACQAALPGLVDTLGTEHRWSALRALELLCVGGADVGPAVPVLAGLLLDRDWPSPGNTASIYDCLRGAVQAGHDATVGWPFLAVRPAKPSTIVDRSRLRVIEAGAARGLRLGRLADELIERLADPLPPEQLGVVDYGNAVAANGATLAALAYEGAANETAADGDAADGAAPTRAEGAR